MNRSKQAGMAKKAIGVLLVGLVFVLVPFAEAQQQSKIAKVGWLSIRPASIEATGRYEATRRLLSELGWVEGKTITF